MLVIGQQANVLLFDNERNKQKQTANDFIHSTFSL